jgi:multicomponent K+:H+ antiporter subunit G
MSALEQLPVWADVLIAAMLLVSAATALTGSFALVRFSDFYKRLHGPTKATTLGVGGVLVASAVYFTVRGPGFSVHEFLITLFLFLTAPVSANLLVKAALHLARVGPPHET